ncbi:MAG: ABC transporter permease [Pirellulaceae bacterium]|nr:ABC transporter permease [Pirellulaceae bacterium]
MIRTIIQISLLRLWNNKAEWVLTFIVPILFFCIFAWIFGARGSGATPQLKIAVCDEVNSPTAQTTIQILEQTKSLRFHEPIEQSIRATAKHRMTRSTAEALVRRGMVSAAIVIASKSQSDTSFTSAPQNAPLQIDVIVDSFDQVAGQVILALVQKSVVAAQLQQDANRLRVVQGGYMKMSKSEPTALAAGSWGSVSPTQTPEASAYGSVETASSFRIVEPAACAVPLTVASGPPASLDGKSFAMPTVALVDVLGAKKTNPVIAMYAAGIAVMFLLFSATTASGSLLEERENATLERLLCSQMTMDHLLMGKWCYLVLLGVLQTTIMFSTGAIFFGLNLLDHLDGFFVMTIVTASAAASFALMLAAICRTRAQLGWLSTVVILSMSALGGSMVPRYLMSESIQRVGQFTFNAWALDGYNKVFWRELPLKELQNELAVLVAMAFVFMVTARMFAIRWDRT